MNIFYNRENEIKFLEELLSEEPNLVNKEEKHQEWSKKAKKKFYKYRNELKLERRRKKENLPLNRAVCLIFCKFYSIPPILLF